MAHQDVYQIKLVRSSERERERVYEADSLSLPKQNTETIRTTSVFLLPEKKKSTASLIPFK